MSKIYFSKMEVQSFLELKIMDNLATEDELEMYEEYVWNGKLNKNNYTYKCLIMEMKNIYLGE